MLARSARSASNVDPRVLGRDGVSVLAQGSNHGAFGSGIGSGLYDLLTRTAVSLALAI